LDLSAFGSLVQSANVAGFNPVFFADIAPDQLISGPVLSNDFISHLSSAPDPGFTFADNPALFNELIGVPEPSTLPVLALGLIGMIFISKVSRSEEHSRQFDAPSSGVSSLFGVQFWL
jgi:hypothetical protein